MKKIDYTMIACAVLPLVFSTACAASQPTTETATISQKPKQADNDKPLPPLPVMRPTSVLALGETPEELQNNAWKKVATEADQKRLYQWPKALSSGQSAAVQSGEGEIVGDPVGLFGVNARRASSDIPEGLYNCAITKMGGPDGRGLPFITYPGFKCRVKEEDGRKHFTKLTGSQRTVGWIYPASEQHSVYLGTLFYGYENKATPYGQTEERDQAAALQRIGKDRWRMVFPYPYYESVVNVMELTPVK